MEKIYWDKHEEEISFEMKQLTESFVLVIVIQYRMKSAT